MTPALFLVLFAFGQQGTRFDILYAVREERLTENFSLKPRLLEQYFISFVKQYLTHLDHAFDEQWFAAGTWILQTVRLCGYVDFFRYFFIIKYAFKRRQFSRLASKTLFIKQVISRINLVVP
ncbi:hypothetical protein KXD40_009215 [Peronospora effusa]|nr:hypothetical protein KXD40_009215 [Peronospora effusa]